MSKNLVISVILFFMGGALVLQEPDVPVQDSADAETATEASTVSVINITGTIGPTTTNYLQRTREIAEQRGDEALIIELNTPGGLLDSTQDIVRIMLASELPIVVYVAPEGANAGSAGTFITLASHIAAMAPATNIGAASPVSMGGGEMDSVAQKKIFEYSESYIESIAEQRDRNAEWARSAVRDGVAITSTEAIELNVVDLIAADLQDLLEQIDGMEIEGRELNTASADINRIDRNLAEIFFSFILRPEIMLILTLIAIYGIVGEVTSPGAIIPGMSGAIALILLLYGVAAMPINIAGFLLIGLALALFVIEAFTPTFGVLLTGGAVSFFLGALMLFQDMPEEMQISLYWLVPATLLTVFFFAWIVSFGIRAQFGEPKSGLESLVGKDALVLDRVDENGGRVSVSGEYWNAVSEEPIEEGERCEIVEFQGLKIIVKPKNKEKEISNG
ncbi:MAG: nodulation protein NfeD [Balneolaceae bacterium]